MVAGGAGLVATLATLALSGIGPAGAELDPGSAFTAVARADALGIEYLNTAAPVFGDNAVLYGTPATAQAQVDSNGRSTAFAAAPYPGDVMVGLPANGNGVAAGSGFPALFPPYPFFVQSEYPIAPSAERTQSGITLAARSERYASGGDARSGLITGDVVAGAQSQASSRAEVDQVTGAITATADSRVDAFKVTDALQVGKSAGHARIVSAPGQGVVKETSFTVGSLIVNGTELGVTDHGFIIGDHQAPGLDPGPVLEGLRQAGIDVEFLPATGSGSSIESAGLRISQVQDFGGQRQRVSLVLGRVSARIDGAATPADSGGLDPVVTGDTSSYPPPAAGPDAAATPIAGGTGTVPSLAVQAEVPRGSAHPHEAALAAAGGPMPAPPRPATQPAAVASPVRLRYGLLDDDATWFYTALAATAALVVAGSRLLARGVARTAGTPSVLRVRSRPMSPKTLIGGSP
jgi:hypothetical protein